MCYGKSWVCLQGYLSSQPSGDGVASSSNSESGYAAHSFYTPDCVKQSQTYPKIWQGCYKQLFCSEVLESKLLNCRLSIHYFDFCVGTVLSSLTGFASWVGIDWEKLNEVKVRWHSLVKNKRGGPIWEEHGKQNVPAGVWFSHCSWQTWMTVIWRPGIPCLGSEVWDLLVKNSTESSYRTHGFILTYGMFKGKESVPREVIQGKSLVVTGNISSIFCKILYPSFRTLVL